MKTDAPKTSRMVAAEIVQRWLETGDFPDRLMDRVTADRGFVMELVYGTVKWIRQLEWVLKHCSKHLPEVPLRAHAMVGIHQLLHMDQVQTYAAVNETVAGVKLLFGQAQANFVNAILRRVLREREGLLRGLAGQPLGVRTSHPEVLVERWERAFGPDRTAALCAWNNTPASVVLRVNTGRVAMSDFLDRLAVLDLRAEPHAFSPDRFCTLPRGVAVESVPGFSDGWFTVQDPSTAVAVDWLDPKPRERILDACAAPGGKTMVLAEKMGGGGTLTAMDLHEDRLMTLRKNLERMSFRDVRVVQGNMEAEGPGGPGCTVLEGEEFDGILLDVPCMNTGVLRRRPDARWRFSLERLQKVTLHQQAILEGAAGMLRTQGRMVYSTCSLEPEEDELLVGAWLQRHSGFKLVRQQKLFPPEAGVDGSFAALIVCEERERRKKA